MTDHRTPIEAPPCPELVERVARAIADARSWQTTPLTLGDWDDRSDGEREPFIRLAAAAIEATRPTAATGQSLDEPNAELLEDITWLRERAFFTEKCGDETIYERIAKRLETPAPTGQDDVVKGLVEALEVLVGAIGQDGTRQLCIEQEMLAAGCAIALARTGVTLNG